MPPELKVISASLRLCVINFVMKPVYAVVMAGGQGTRLWPLSRKAHPKQFLKLAGDGRSLIQAAVARSARVTGHIERVLVVAPLEQAEMVRADLPDLPPQNLILEPVGRNTAAAIGLAAIEIERRDPRAVMGVFPADHLFRVEAPWLTAVQTALNFAAQSDALVTIGLRPTSPSPNYGYLKLGPRLNFEADRPVYRVQQFVEKPTVATAQTYVNSGQYFWNTGTFAWQVATLLRAFETHLPAHFAGLRTLQAAPDSWETLSQVYPALENISIDYGIMEKADEVAVVQADFERIDLGNLSNLSELAKLSDGAEWSVDAAGNVGLGNGLAVGGAGNLVYDQTGRGFTAIFGADDLILIRQDDVVVALPKDQAYRIKDLLAELRARGLETYL